MDVHNKVGMILVIGNIAAGKTHVCQLLKSRLGWRYISIDDLRRKFGDGSFTKEYFCRSKLLEAIEKMDSIIVEFSGGGIHKHAINQAIKRRKGTVLVLFILSSLKIVKENISHKEWNIPYPWEGYPVDYIETLEKELMDDKLAKFWNKGNMIYTELLNDKSDITLLEKQVNQIINAFW